MKRLLVFFWLVPAAWNPSSGQEARIEVHAGQVTHRLTRTMTGACLEDVNHEVYGGLYSQMVFGESFQEPAPPEAIRGFTGYGGNWSVREGVVSVDPEAGPKLISTEPPFAEGEVGVELFLPGNSGGVAGLIVKAGEPGVGPDRFSGYEVALDSRRQLLVIGRHRQNWEPLRNVPCSVPSDRWISLEVRISERRLAVTVDGKLLESYEDRDHPLPAGAAGLRTFERECRYRNLWIRSGGGEARKLPFQSEKQWDGGVSGMWRALRRGTAQGAFGLESREPFTGRWSQRITFKAGEGEIGIENRGLNRWGLSYREAKPYQGYLWARAEEPLELVAALESGDGSRSYAEATVRLQSREWTKLPFTLTPSGSERSGRFAFLLRRPGSVLLGHAFLEPGEWGRFKGLPVRRDVVEGLLEGGLTVLRYGGSMVNHAEYRWKKMLGPRDRRPPYRGTWYPYSSNGWGILDFLDLCEAAGLLGIPAFNMDETPEDLGDFLEYVNGPKESVWGGKRAAAGHPEPYRLELLELGNEESIDEGYWRRWKPLAEAIWARDRGVTLVAGDFAYDKPFDDPRAVEGAASRIKDLSAHRKIVDLARERGRRVWFDVHIWNEEPRQPDGLAGVQSFARALSGMAPEAPPSVVVFELNAKKHGIQRALSTAHVLNQLERSGDRIPIVCSANCLQPDHQNDNGWDQGLLFLNPSQVWGQPPYHVMRMISRGYLPLCVKADSSSPRSALDVTSKKSEDGKVLQLQVVNVEPAPVEARIALTGFAPQSPLARVVQLSGGLEEVNTAEEPRRIEPRESRWRHQLQGGVTRYTFPGHSFTVIRLE